MQRIGAMLDEVNNSSVGRGSPSPSMRILLIGLIFACLLPGMAGSASLLYFAYWDRRTELEHATIQTARALVQTVDAELARAQMATQTLALSPHLTTRNFAAFHAQALALVSYMGFDSNFKLIDESGQQLVNTLLPFPGALPRNKSSEHLRPVFTTGQSVISDVHLDPVGQQPVIRIDVPVKQGTRTLYVLCFTLPTDDLGKIVKKQRLPSEWVVSILDGHRKLAFRTHGADRFLGKEASPDLRKRMAEVAEGIVNGTTLEGISVSTAFSNSTTSNWAVAIAIPKQTFIAELLQRFVWLTVLIVGMLAAGILLALTLARRIGESIHALTAPALALGAGEPVTVPRLFLREADEVGNAILTASKLLLQTEGQRRQSETHLAATVRLLDAHLHNSPLAIIEFDPDFRVLRWSSEAEHLFGWSEVAVLGRSVLTMRWVHEDDVRKVRKGWEELQSGDRQSNMCSNRNYRHDGTMVHCEWYNSALHDENGNLISVLSQVLDVSERHEAIAALSVAKVQAEQASRAKSAFLATMSHEIRTPVHAIIGLTGLLADSALNRRQRDYADKIQLSARTLRALIDDVLDFSKIESGALQLEQAPFSLNAMLRTTAAIISTSMRDKPIEALFDLALDLPDALIGDVMRLQQILLNLTSNAVKFTDAGEVVVSVCCLAEEAGWATLQFTVRDTGIGIESEQLGRIFDVFIQGDAAMTRQYGGTGLGLAISARLANLMGARIEVESTPGRGSEFRFAVTLALADSARAQPLADKPSALSILIVDDHPLARDILTQTCTDFGWQATAVDSGAAGLDELRRSCTEGRDYDLMLLDWHMPGMDGIEMLRQAYADPDIGLPFVLLMAPTFELEYAVAASDDLYLDGIVAKPMTPTSLFEAVTRANAGDFTEILPSASRADRRLEGMRLLIVEDNAINQQVIEETLVNAGAKVVIASNGLAAIEALRVPDARFDGVLMDIQMPVMDGYAATKVIREQMGQIDLPIIALTANAMPEAREKSRLAGMVGHLVKPIDVGGLFDILIVSGVVERRGAHSVSSGFTARVSAPGLSLAGVDVVAALATFGGDQKKYLTLLRQFMASHADDAMAARRLYSASDANGAARLLHELRGMASLLQVTTVASLTAAIERALRDNNTQTVMSLFEELQLAVIALAESIELCEALSVTG